jgi:hypothetical protein
MIIFGTNLYGKVDRVPGLCYVVTRFFHLWFFPLIPVQTYLILEAQGKRGLAIPMSGKSVLIGWLRPACLVVLVISTAVTIAGLLDYVKWDGEARLLLASAPWFCGSALLFGLSYLFGKVSPRRAVELGRYMGLSEEAMQGMLTRKEERLKDLEAYLSANPDALNRSDQRARRTEEDEGEGPSDPSIQRDHRD